MAQSNYTLANKSAPASRAKINDVFQSIATNNSGTAPPSTTFPHQWWYDTTTNVLKQRNAADSAWINIGSFDQEAGTFVASVVQLSQGQVEDDTSTVFGAVSGQRLEQQTNATFNVTGDAPKYACRAWVNFNGRVASGNIRSSGNVSSVTRDGTGQYTVSLITPIIDSNYSVALSADNETDGPALRTIRIDSLSTGSFVIGVIDTSSSRRNTETITAAIFR